MAQKVDKQEIRKDFYNMTNEEALYQAKLIIEQLPEEEYRLLPVDQVNYINENFAYNENIKINPNTPLSEQNLDEQTVEILQNLMDETDFYDLKKYNADTISLKTEIIDLKTEIKQINLKQDNKLSEIKKMVLEYKDALEKANTEISNLKESNEQLFTSLNKVPKFFRKIFFKDDINKYYLNS